jgi:hypothetical protein
VDNAELERLLELVKSFREREKTMASAFTRGNAGPVLLWQWLGASEAYGRCAAELSTLLEKSK